MKPPRSTHIILISLLLVPLQSGFAAWEPVQRPETGSTILSAGAAFETTPDELGEDADNFLGGMVSATWVRDNNYFWEIMMTRNENRVGTVIGRQDTEQLHASFNAGYLFPQRSNWRPYVSLGLGAGRFDNGADFKSDETEFNAGFGGYYELTERMFVRGDLRVMSRSDVDWGPVASFGLAFQLGDITPDPPKDADEDGVPDPSDDCPNTPMGSQVNSNGCPDSDGDGVYDDSDDCPSTPRGARVDSRGCPPPPSQVDSEEMMRATAEDAHVVILFEYDMHEFSSEYDDDLQKLADLLGEHPQMSVVIEGHTDSRGSESYNLALSERRANQVRDHLIGLGVNASRISIVAKGESEPRASNDTEQGRALNRRAISVSPTIN